jgi:hypothetical protein
MIARTFLEAVRCEGCGAEFPGGWELIGPGEWYSHECKTAGTECESCEGGHYTAWVGLDLRHDGRVVGSAQWICDACPDDTGEYYADLTAEECEKIGVLPIGGAGE